MSVDSLPQLEDDLDGFDREAGGSRRIMGLLRSTLSQAANRTGATMLTRAEYLALIRNPEMGSVVFDTHDEETMLGPPWRSVDPSEYEKVPSDEGTKLMNSGRFGTSSRGFSAKKQLARRILDRELGVYEPRERLANQNLMAQSMLPSTKPEMTIHFDEPVYSGQFSDDGNFFFACGHDFKVRMYDTSNPYSWSHYKTVIYPFGQWTPDGRLAEPDNKWLAYTSISSTVSLAPTDPNDNRRPVPARPARRHRPEPHGLAGPAWLRHLLDPLLGRRPRAGGRDQRQLHRRLRHRVAEGAAHGIRPRR